MQYLFLDESGNLHKNSPDKYFVIGGVFTNNYADIKKSYVEINHDLKAKYGFWYRIKSCLSKYGRKNGYSG